MNNVKTATKNKTGLRWIWLALVILVLDQLSKYMIYTTFTLYESIKVLPFFNLTLMHNKGAAFSFLSEHPVVAVWLFSTIAIIMSIVLVFWLRSISVSNKWMGIALSLVLGGAIGNLIDRLYHGHVIDFLDFHLAGSHFPAFNIADSAITIGAVMIFLSMFTSKS